MIGVHFRDKEIEAMVKFFGICFEIFINGEKMSTAGLSKFGVLSALLTWVKRNAKARPKSIPKSLWCKEELNINVSGMSTHQNKNICERLTWLDRGLKIGDEIQIKISKKTNHDPPQSRRREKFKLKGNKRENKKKGKKGKYY